MRSAEAEKLQTLSVGVVLEQLREWLPPEEKIIVTELLPSAP
jgi:hypothetical protein